MSIHISEGNSKIGKIPNISLPPIISCPRNIPCARDCYAKKTYRNYPSVKNAWNENLAAWKASPSQYFNELAWYIDKRKPEYFRYHVSGDIQGQHYYYNMVKLARYFPDTRFMTYTKTSFALGQSHLPENLVIIRSLWLKESDSDIKAPIFKVFTNGGLLDKGDDKGYKKCIGDCSECKLCYHATDSTRIAVRMH